MVQTLKHYTIESTLGTGGIGIVYVARDTRLQRLVAIKLLKPELVSDPARKTRFLREARAATALSHPAIAQVYDIDEVDGTTFIAMEYIDGRTVAVDKAPAKTYIRLTSLIDEINKKRFLSKPVTAVIKDDLSEAEYRNLLRTAGVTYARDE